MDDDPAVLRLTSHALVAEGLDVVTASDGTVALDLLWAVGEDQPDLLILDLDLPELGGEAVARRYARFPVPDAPILVCSGNAEAPSIAARIGAAGLVPKPFDLDHLTATVWGIVNPSLERRAA